MALKTNNRRDFLSNTNSDDYILPEVKEACSHKDVMADFKLDISDLKFQKTKEYNISRILTDYIVTSFKKIESKEIKFNQTNIAEVDEYLNRLALTDYHIAKNFLETIWLNYSKTYDDCSGGYVEDKGLLYFQEIVLLIFSISFELSEQKVKLEDLKVLIDEHYNKTMKSKYVDFIYKFIEYMLENNVSATDFVLYFFKIQENDSNFSCLNDSAILLSNLFYQTKIYFNYKYDVNPIDKKTSEFFESLNIVNKQKKVLKHDLASYYKIFFNKNIELSLQKTYQITSFLQKLYDNNNIDILISKKIYNLISFCISNKNDMILYRERLYKEFIKDNNLVKKIPYDYYASRVRNLEEKDSFLKGEILFDGVYAQKNYNKAYINFKSSYDLGSKGIWMFKYAICTYKTTQSIDKAREIIVDFLKFYDSKEVNEPSAYFEILSAYITLTLIFIYDEDIDSAERYNQKCRLFLKCINELLNSSKEIATNNYISILVKKTKSIENLLDYILLVLSFEKNDAKNIAYKLFIEILEDHVSVIDIEYDISKIRRMVGI